MTTCTVREQVVLPDGTPAAGLTAEVSVVGKSGRPIGAFTDDGEAVVSPRRVTIAADGTWELGLHPNSELIPREAVYRREVTTGLNARFVAYFVVAPCEDGATEPQSPTYTDPPCDDPPSAALTQHIADHNAHCCAELGDRVRLLERRQGAALTHEFSSCAWEGFSPVIALDRPPQTFTPSVEDGRGVVTASASDATEHHVIYARQNTLWADSEVTSVIWGPLGWDGTNAQQGHVHRLRQVDEDTFECVIAATSIAFGQGYNQLHVRAIRFGASGSRDDFFQSLGDNVSATATIDRRSEVRAVRRHEAFGFWRHLYRAQERHLLAHVTTADRVTIDEMADASFDKADIAVNGYNPSTGGLVVIDNATPGDVPWQPVAVGRVTPRTNERRWVPYVLRTRVVGGTAEALTMTVARWRYGEQEPSDGDPSVVTATMAPSEGVPAMPAAAGLCGLWTAHMREGSAAVFGGPVGFRDLACG